MSDSDHQLIEVRDVSKIYGQGVGQVRALDGISIDIRRGDFAVLAGPSGSGKTTLLNIIGALDRPSTGTVRLDGDDLAALNSRRLAEFRLRRYGYIFQAYNLLPVLSAYENAEFVLLLQGVRAAERAPIVNKVLADVGLTKLAHRRPAELSGGQQQRVAVARAIAGQPALVLADEPTANLDSKTGAALVELMRQLNEQEGVTFLFSSHDSKVIDHSKRLIRLEDGRIVSDEGGNLAA